MRTGQLVVAIALASAAGCSKKHAAPAQAAPTPVAPAPQPAPAAPPATPPADHAGSAAKPAEDSAAKIAAAAATVTAKDFPRLDHDEADLLQQIQSAVEGVVNATNPTDRAAAQAKLDALKARQAELQPRLEAARLAAARDKTDHASKDCKTPGAKGCP